MLSVYKSEKILNEKVLGTYANHNTKVVFIKQFSKKCCLATGQMSQTSRKFLYNVGIEMSFEELANLTDAVGNMSKQPHVVNYAEINETTDASGNSYRLVLKRSEYDMVMFPTFPHNDTFTDSRKFKIIASPNTTTAEEYTFTHHPNDYGVMNLSEAKIKATISLKANDGQNLANDRVVMLGIAPLRMGWKTREVLINNERINSVTSQENEIAYIDHIIREVPSAYNNERSITGCIHNTPGASDSVVQLTDPTHAGHANKGAGARYQLCHEDTPLLCYDYVNIMGDNKRYIPSSFEIKIRLRRLDKNKALFGSGAHCAAANIHYDDLEIHIPAYKPKAQLMGAINQAMIQNGEEVKYYTRSHRYVPIPVAAGTQKILKNDIFTGSRPTRVYTYIRTQARYNGSHILNPNRIIFPNLDFFGLKVNDAFVESTIENSREAYINLRRILNRNFEEMPFSYEDYLTDYGVIVTDLSENKDSYNQTLPNTTSGIVSVEMRLAGNLAADSQLIMIGEFRNMLSVGYQTQARLKFDF